MSAIRIEVEERIKQEEIVTKETMSQVEVRRKKEINIIEAEKSGCPAVAEAEKQSCRRTLETQIVQTRDDLSVQIGIIKDSQESLLESTRVDFEARYAALLQTKLDEETKLSNQKRAAIQVLVDERDKCAAQGQEKVATCAEKVDAELFEMRSTRDFNIAVVKTDAETEVQRVTTVRHSQVVKVQAQLEEQLKNIREKRYEQLEKIMRKCEGGREGGECPELDCSLCPAEGSG